MTTDSFRYVWECFGIDPLEQLIQERQDKCNKKYSACDNLLCLVICRHYFVCLCVSSINSFNNALFIICATMFMVKLKIYIKLKNKKPAKILEKIDVI